MKSKNAGQNDTEATKTGDYLQILESGTFKGIMQWEELDALWEKVRAKEQWYAYTIGEPPPTAPTTNDLLNVFIIETDATLRRLGNKRYCGMVYTDNRENPAFVTLYHPHRVGGCGTGGNFTMPGWTLTQIPPIDLPEHFTPAKKSPFGRIFG